jgi:hypothetical protein
MKLESWNGHMSNTLRNRRMDMIELLFLGNDLIEKAKAAATKVIIVKARPNWRKRNGDFSKCWKTFGSVWPLVGPFK